MITLLFRRVFVKIVANPAKPGLRYLSFYMAAE